MSSCGEYLKHSKNVLSLLLALILAAILHNRVSARSKGKGETEFQKEFSFDFLKLNGDPATEVCFCRNKFMFLGKKLKSKCCNFQVIFLNDIEMSTTIELAFEGENCSVLLLRLRFEIKSSNVRPIRIYR